MKNPLIRFSQHIALALSICLLAACATVTQAPNPLTTAPKATESVVVLSITSNTAQVAGISTISLSRTQTVAGSNVKESYVLNQILPGLSRDTSMFVGVLPQGEYQFSSFSDPKTRQSLTFNSDMNKRIGRFVVKAGSNVDLGRVIMTPVNTNVMVGRSAIVASNLPLLKRFSPEHAKLFERGSVDTGWAEPRAAIDRVEEYALITPVGFDQPRETKEGNVVGGSRLGSVLMRTKPTVTVDSSGATKAGTYGRWSVLRSDGLESILSVLPVDMPDTKLVAVGELGSMHKLASVVVGGKTQPKLVPVDPGNMPAGNLMFISGNDKAGWYIANQNNKTISIYKSAKLEAGQWTVERTETLENSFWSGPASLWLFHTNNGFGYATSAGKIHLMNHATGQWASTAAPNNHGLRGIAYDPLGQSASTGSIGILTSPGGGLGGVFAGTYLSADEGKTWREIKPEFSVKVSAPRQTQSGKILIGGGVFSKPELHVSEDKGASWKRLSDFALNQQLVLLPSGNMLGISNSNFGLFDVSYSSDEGKTWLLEYTNFDKAVYDAKKAKN